jgi:hypothetical protein
MELNKKVGFFTGAALLMFASSANAIDIEQGFVAAYIGNTNVDESEADFDADSTSFRIGGGYRVVKNLALEAYYVNYGEADQSYPNDAAFLGVDELSLSVEATAIQLQALGIFPVSESVDLNAKLGLAVWDADLCATARLGNNTGTSCVSDDGSDLVYGFGATFNISSDFAARVEYELGEFDGTDINTIMLGVAYGF